MNNDKLGLIEEVDDEDDAQGPFGLNVIEKNIG